MVGNGLYLPGRIEGNGVDWFCPPGGDIQNDYIRFQTLRLVDTAPIQTL